MKHLIILYGGFGTLQNAKQQAMIDGRSTCMYREYAREFGEIIYLTPQKCSTDWEQSIPDKEKLLEYLTTKPNSLVWSVKHCPEKDEILTKTKNKKIYYSCCAYNTINQSCNVSLVDTRKRVQGNAVTWFKGKDPNFWYPGSTKEYDYVLSGRRDDKNESYFINRLTKEIKEPRSVLWVAGKHHSDKINKSHHNITLTDFVPMNNMPNLLSKGKIGVLLSEHPAEGFPQTFLEMTMVGVPVLYLDSAPYNPHYFGKKNSLITDKESCVHNAKVMLSQWHVNKPQQCRNFAVDRYSLKKSYQGILDSL